jgi:outer membrane protein assembly factor BamB
MLGGLIAVPGGAAQAGQTSFTDVTTNPHRWSIKAVEDAGITAGCAPGLYCPSWSVTRAQMASFLARALSLPPRAHTFTDVSAKNNHSGAIGALAHAGITSGCAPGRFCPGDPVTRGQMATFLHRALQLEPGSVAAFSDVGPNHTHADGIGAIARAGITSGCAPDLYCPTTAVSRAQMATFLARGLDLDRGLEGCPAVGATTRERFGAAVRGMPLNSGAAIDDKLYLFSLDVSPSRILEYDTVTERVLRTIPVPNGTRTWATHVMDGVVYFGQWGTSGTETNLFRFDPARDEVEPVAHVPTRGEFWSLTSDDEGLLYAGTRHLGQVATIDPQTGEVGTLAFDQPEDVPDGQVTRLVHHDDRLYLGLGRDRPRLLVRHLDEDRGTEDITPEEVRDGIGGVYSLDVDEHFIAFGTQQDAARLVVIENGPEHEVVHLARFDDEPVISGTTIHGSTIYAAGNGSGSLYALDPDTGEVSWLDTPIANAPTRDLLPANGHLHGISGAGAVWEHDPSARTSVVRDVTKIGADAEALLPQSLSVGPQEALVGVNNAAFLRSVLDPSRTWRTFLPGEPKAGVDVGDDHYVVNYPHATLWRVPSDGAPTLAADWTDVFNRPRHIHHDAANGRLLITARPGFSAEPRGALITFDLSTRTFEVFADPLTARSGDEVDDVPDDPTEPPSEEPPSSIPLERAASYGSWAIVGGDSANATVAAIDDDGAVVWRVDAATDRGRVTGLAVAQETVYGLTRQGWLFALDARSGAAVQPPVRVLSGNSGGELLWKAGALYAVNANTLVAVDPVTYRVHTVATGLGAETFNAPVLRTDADCRLYVLRGRDLERISHDLWTR